MRGLGGEIGHLCVDFRGSVCNCGGRGCLELYASGTGIARRMREKWRAAGAPGVLPEEFSAFDVTDLWFKEEPVASEVMNEAIQALASALAGLIHTFNPGKIVIGGGVADSGKPLFERLRAETAIRTMPSFYETVKIEPARFGSDSGMIGAAALLFTHRM
jgi:glucokinase